MLIDTDVIIWYIKGNSNAQKLINDSKYFSVSAVTYMELVQGMRNKNELRSLRQAFKQWNTTVIPISEEISNRAMFFVENHYLSHSIQLADALIAATSVAYGKSIITSNSKHYKILKGVHLIKFNV